MDPSYIQIGVAVATIYVVGRWFFAQATAPSDDEFANMDTADHPRRTGVSQEQIETVLSAFPHVTENQARWDLGRSGSLEMTMERLLRDGRLPTPPANLFPPEGNVPRPRPSATAPTDAKAPTNPSRAGGPPTLIQKLNLQARAEEQDALVRDSKGKGKAVDPAEHAGRSENPVKATPGDSREDALKERKAKMVLDARWQMLQKDKGQ